MGKRPSLRIFMGVNVRGEWRRVGWSIPTFSFKLNKLIPVFKKFDPKCEIVENVPALFLFNGESSHYV